ncbi:MAG: GNAT family N-acetyltransferase [Candidatus Merdivicinus sp.]|jgi:putative acetyltransferase
MRIREYRPDDCTEILRLFYDTVHTVNAKDYSAEQLAVWAPKTPDFSRWQRTLGAHNSYVAEEEGRITGFADLDIPACYFDRLYIHKDYQRQGIASLLADRIEADARAAGISRLEVAASITARPFFEKRGYRLVREQQVERGGILLTNFVMEKNWYLYGEEAYRMFAGENLTNSLAKKIETCYTETILKTHRPGL